MNRDDREAFDSTLDELRALGTDVCGKAATLLTHYAPHAASHHSQPEGEAVLLAARLLYVLAHETIEESLG